MKIKIIVLFFIAVLMAVTSGCSDDDNSGKKDPGDLLSTCVYTYDASVSTQEGVMSLEYSDAVYWIFGETWLDPLKIITSAGATSALTSYDCDDAMDFLRDASGTMAQVIPNTSSEDWYNFINADWTGDSTSSKYVIWPLSGFVYNDLGYIFYEKFEIINNNYFNIADIGVGLSTAERGEIAVRLTPNKYEAEPTLFWAGGDVKWGAASIIAQDEYIYVYGKKTTDGLNPAYYVARVDASSATDISAYRYYNGSDWVVDDSSAASVFNGMNSLSLSYNDYLGKYIMVSSPPLSNDIEIRTAESPEGPFSEASLLFTNDAASDWGVNYVRLHPAFNEESDRVIFLSYYVQPNSGMGEKGIRMARYRFR